MELTFQIDRIPLEGLDLRGELDRDEVWSCLNALGDTGFSAPDGVQVSLHVDKIEHALRITGTLRGTVVTDCSRCLNEAKLVVDSAVDMTLFPTKGDESDEAEQELDRSFPSLTDAGVQSGLYSGPKVDATDVVREVLLLELPMRPLCTEDCAGLCDLCGHNLNEGPCQCTREEIDPRWEKLKDLKLN